MRSNWGLLGVALSALIATLAGTPSVVAQRNIPRIALKSGESTEVRNYFYIVNCQSIMIGQPTLDILEGPDELTVTLKEAMISPRAQNCAKPVPGGNVVVTAKQIDEPKEAKLTYRLKFNTKQGERQTSETLLVSLFP